jgi:hypothetical protein
MIKQKNLDFYSLLLFVTFYLWRMNTVNVPSKNNKQKNLAPWRSPTKRAVSGAGSGYWSGSISQRYGSGDPDPNQNVTDPQHWLKGYRYLNWLSLNWEGGIWSLFSDKTTANSNDDIPLFSLSNLPFCRVGPWPPASPRGAFLPGEYCCARVEAKPNSLTSPLAAHWSDNDLLSLQSAEPFPVSEEEPVALKSLLVPLWPPV